MNGTASNPFRAALLVAHVLFLVLLVLAWKHAEARMLNVDSAWQFFKWVNAPNIEVEVFRFSAVVPQLLVKWCVLVGMPLDGLVVVGSITHVLVGFAVFLLCAHVFDAPRSAVACALSAVLCTRLSFYAPVLEANYLLSYPFLLLGMLEGGRVSRSWRRMMLAFLALGVSLVVHPVGWVVMGSVLVYRYAAYPTDRSFVGWLLMAVGSWTVLGRLILPPSPYEKGLYVAMADGLLDLSNMGHWSSTDYLVGHTWRDTAHLLPCLTLCLAVIVAAIVKHRFRTLAVVLLGWCGFLVINLLTYSTGETAVMMEKSFVPMAVLVAVPALDLFEPRTHGLRIVFLSTIVLFLFVKVRHIAFAARPAEARLQALMTIVDAEGGAKRAMLHEDLQRIGVEVHWALPFETLLASSLSGPSRSVTVLCADECEGWEKTRGIWAGAWGSDADPSILDTAYFTVQQGSYQLISSTGRSATELLIIE